MQTINVTINGKLEHLPAPQTVWTLLEHLHIASDRIAVELNCSLVRKRDWRATVVPAEAALEIVEFVGGG